LRGDDAKKYIETGISTDHECFTKEEALDKLGLGMKIIIREGSAAKNFEALIDLLNDYPDDIMFCSDDKHPDSLVEGHINLLCSRAVKKGIDVFKVLQAACINPVNHYRLEVGLLRAGDSADFIVVKDLENFEVLQTYVGGTLIAENGASKIIPNRILQNDKPINNFHCIKKNIEDFAVHAASATVQNIPVIEAMDGQLITNKIFVTPKVIQGKIVVDIENDILKIVVVNRFEDKPIAKAFIKNFGLKNGAIASSVAHDSHNIVAVGVDDESLCRAVNLIITNKGGISAVDGITEHFLALPVAGLMSTEDGYLVAEKYAALDKAAKELGSTLSAPFMTLSFMALLVIPHLKLSDKGLFDGDEFKFAEM
jgi:adenine deaminase